MRTKLILSIILLSFAVGCQDSQQTNQSVSDQDISSVIIPEGTTFPEQMVGVWINDQLGWVLRIEEDGRLSKLRHTIGRRDLAAGQLSEFSLVDGGKGFMQPGPWQVEYVPEANEVVVDTSLEGFEFAIPAGKFSGSSRDIFIGKVPEPGEITWKVTWFSRPVYVATTQSKMFDNYQLPHEPSDEEREIIFEKIDPSKLRHEH